MPFVVLYALDAEDTEARLVARSGIDAGTLSESGDH
jgi:hypothetical protein